MTKNQELIKLKDLYKQESETTDIEIAAFVEWLRRKGYEMPEPPTPEQVLAKQVVRALKEETREDPETGETYKVNVCFAADSAGNGVLWLDIDEATRKKMVNVVGQRRKQFVADAIQLDLFVDRWNKKNPFEEPIVVQYDVTFDVVLAKNAREDEGAPA